MIPRKHSSSLADPYSRFTKNDSKIPIWALVGIGMIALMGLSYAQVAGVLHHPGEINWNAIIANPILVGTEFLGAINAVSNASAGKTTGVNADSLDGLDSLAFSGGTGGGVQHAEDTPHADGEIGDLVLAVRNDSGTVLSNVTGDYTPLSTDNTGRLRVNAGTISVTTTQDGEYYYQQCGYLTGGQAGVVFPVLIGFPAAVSPQSCNDQGSTHQPDNCEVGDVDLGVDCYPTDIEIWEDSPEGNVFLLTGMCQRVCQDLD